MKKIFHLTDEQYDFAKKCVTMYAPGVGVAITAIGTLWGANPDTLAKIVGTLTALTGLAGVFLNISTSQYNKGDESDES